MRLLRSTINQCHYNSLTAKANTSKYVKINQSCYLFSSVGLSFFVFNNATNVGNISRTTILITIVTWKKIVPSYCSLQWHYFHRKCWGSYTGSFWCGQMATIQTDLTFLLSIISHEAIAFHTFSYSLAKWDH